MPVIESGFQTPEIMSPIAIARITNVVAEIQNQMFPGSIFATYSDRAHAIVPTAPKNVRSTIAARTTGVHFQNPNCMNVSIRTIAP